MPELERLEEKKKKYQAMRDEVETDSYNIEAKVEAYRQQLVAECELDRTQKLEKIDSYLEVLDELITETQSELEQKITEENQIKEEE